MGIAAPDSVVAGPYKVSFDLAGAKDMISYQKESMKPEIHEDLSSDYTTEYGFGINITKPSTRKGDFSYHQIYIEINQRNVSTQISDDSYKKTIYSILARGLSLQPMFMSYTDSVQFANRTIDGANGYIGSGQLAGIQLFSMPGYAAIFNPSLDPKHLECQIFSNVPWNEGTLQLLKTIHNREGELRR